VKQFAGLVMALAAASAVQGEAPSATPRSAHQIRPERTGFQETSRYDDVVAFLDALAKASPAVHLTTFGKTSEGLEPAARRDRGTGCHTAGSAAHR